MSYSSYTIDGYGIRVDDIPEVTKEALLRFIHTSVTFEKDYLEWLNGSFGTAFDSCYDVLHDSDISIDDLIEYECDSGHIGLGAIIVSVMNEHEHGIFTLCDDYNASQYVVFEPRYPWNMERYVVGMKESDIVQIFSMYIRILTNKPIKVDYYSVENGG